MPELTDSVVITGVGLLTPLGRGHGATWRAVAAGKVGLGRNPDPDGPEWMRWAGRVQAPELETLLPRELLSQTRFLNRGARLALVAVHDALSQAGAGAPVAPDRRSLFLATGDLTRADAVALHPATTSASTPAGLDLETLNRETVRRVNPFFLLETLANNPFSILSAAFELMGPGTCLAAESPAGALALDLAFRSVRAGRAELAIAVGCGSWLTEVPRLEMASLGLLSRCRDGARSFRPFDRRRDGFIVGEGAAAIVLETRANAHRRGAEVLGTVESTGSSLEASPGLGVADRVTARSMQLAMAHAGCSVAELGFVCAHGSATRKGDRAEASSLEVMAGSSPGVPVCALKPFTGHMGAASDVVEVIIGLLAVRHGQVPGTPNFERGDDSTGHLSLSALTRPCAFPRFVSVAYGLGGTSAAAIISAPGGEVLGD